MESQLYKAGDEGGIGMNEENKYIVEPDNKISQAGFLLKSKFDLQKEEIQKELEKYSYKSTAGTFLLSIFPIMGLHRLTNGKILTGLLFACTAGGAFLWWLYDVLLISSGKFTDQNGKYINTSKVTELSMLLRTMDGHYEEYKREYYDKKYAIWEVEQEEYKSICEELGYEYEGK